MANSRIKDIVTTAAAAASDDYLVIDGATNGTRKIAASDIGGGGGETMYDFTSTLTPSVDSRGVSYYRCKVTPVNSADLTVTNIAKIDGYLDLSGGGSEYIYPLINTQVDVYSTYVVVYFKSIESSTQSTSSATVSGTLHAIAPFEISSITVMM